MCLLDEGLSLPHPALSEALPPSLTMFGHERNDDPRWRFAIAAGHEVYEADHDATAPSAHDNDKSLLLLRSDAPRHEIEVIGHALSHEIDVADWLSYRLEQGERSVLSLRSELLHDRPAADAVVRWSFDHTDYVARYTATKWDDRVLVTVSRCFERDYATLAERFAHIGASVQPFDAGETVYAEPLEQVDAVTPIPWTVALPGSWIWRPRPEQHDGTWFEAVHHVPTKPGESTGDLDGRLAFAMFSRQGARRPRDAANVLLNALRENAIDIDSVDFAEVAAPERFKQAWELQTYIRRDDTLGELRARVMMHARTWVVGGVLGPTRDGGAAAWMRNKRALDVATMTLSF